jgi:hypothetical protein
MRRLLPGAALALLLALPAAAQRPGVYALEGVNPDGSTYAGTLELQPARGGAWRLVWRIGSDVVEGIGLVDGPVLSAAYVLGGRPGVAIYRIRQDGVLEGPWTTGGGLGRETLRPR